MAVTASAAQAAVLTITATTPTWSNAVGGPATLNTANGAFTDVRWGNSTGNGRSGLGFDPVSPPNANITTDTVFLLGTLIHYNRPVTGSIPTSVQLDLATAVLGAVPASQSFAYRFNINETPNSPPCQFPGAPACSDQITFNNLDTSNAFTVGGVAYTIQLLGFSTDNGTTVTSNFISQEGADNNVGLYATITAPTPPGVPEPMSLALFGMALAGLGMAQRRRAS